MRCMLMCGGDGGCGGGGHAAVGGGLHRSLSPRERGLVCAAILTDRPMLAFLGHVFSTFSI